MDANTTYQKRLYLTKPTIIMLHWDYPVSSAVTPILKDIKSCIWLSYTFKDYHEQDE
jgi:hypothetical protein